MSDPGLAILSTLTTRLMTADDPGLIQAFGPPQWGIFDQNGNAVLVADSVGAFQYQRDYEVSDYPQERGAFQSYNKVQTPFQAKLTFYVSSKRIPFLNSIEPVLASLALFTVITPEIQYPSANVIHYDYERTKQGGGATLIAVNVTCEEVRIIAGEDIVSANVANVGNLPGNSTLAGTPQAGSSPSTAPQTVGTLVPGGALTGDSTATPVQFVNQQLVGNLTSLSLNSAQFQTPGQVQTVNPNDTPTINPGPIPFVPL